VLSLLALYLIWSSTYLALRVVVESLPPLLMVSGRFLCAGLIMTVVLAVRGAPWPTLKELAAAIPGGVLFFLIGNGLVAVAEQVVPSGVAALLCATMPLCAAAINALSGQRPRRLEWLGLLLGFAGVVTLCLGKELRANLGSSALLLLAPIGWALGSTVARRMPMAKGLMAGATQMLTGGAAALVVALLRGGAVAGLLGGIWVAGGVFGLHLFTKQYAACAGDELCVRKSGAGGAAWGAAGPRDASPRDPDGKWTDCGGSGADCAAEQSSQLC
jgi:drug/metabolite transporter (DMT)-like permease